MQRIAYLVRQAILLALTLGLSATLAMAEPPYAKFERLGPGKTWEFLHDCSTRDPLINSLRSKIPPELLEEFRNRTSPTPPEKKRMYDHIERGIARNTKENFVSHPFDNVFACKYVTDGHALTSTEVCELLAESTGVRHGVIDDANYCINPDGGGFAAIPWLACERYASKKLGLDLEHTATFARWNGPTHEAVCFYFHSVDHEKRFAPDLARLRKDNRPEDFRFTTEHDFFAHGRQAGETRKLFEKILANPQENHVLKIDGYPPEYGRALVDLLHADVDTALKVAGMTAALTDPNGLIYSARDRGHVPVGNSQNLNLIAIPLAEKMTRLRKDHRKRVEESYNRYFHETDPERKKELRDAYLVETRVLKALKDLDAAATKLRANIQAAYDKE